MNSNFITSWQGLMRQKFSRTINSYQDNVCLKKTTSCHTLKLPRNYVAYHLNGKTVNIDGQLTEEAWTEVPWTETFVGKLRHVT